MRPRCDRVCEDLFDVSVLTRCRRYERYTLLIVLFQPVTMFGDDAFAEVLPGYTAPDPETPWYRSAAHAPTL